MRVLDLIEDIFIYSVEHHKWIILALCMLGSSCPSLLYGISPVIGVQMQHWASHNLKINSEEYKELDKWFNTFSALDIIISIVSGVMIDQIMGTRRVMLISYLLLVFGSLIIWTSSLFTWHFLFITSRAMLKFGGCGLFISQNVYITRIVAPSTKGLVFFISINNFIWFACNLISYKSLIDQYHSSSLLFIGFILTLVYFFFCILLILIDYYAEQYDKLSVINARDHIKLIPSITRVTQLPVIVWLISFASALGTTSFKLWFTILTQSTPLHSFISKTEIITITGIVFCICFLIVGLLMELSGRHIYFSLFSITGVIITTSVCIIGLNTSNILYFLIILAILYVILISSVWSSIPLICSMYDLGLAYGY